MKNGKLTVAIVGMGFGSCFLPIYLKHPDVEHVIMVDTNPDQLKALADMYLLDESYYTTDFVTVLPIPAVAAVDITGRPQIDAAEPRRNQCRRFDNLVGVFGIDFYVHGVNVSETLE